MEQRLVCDTVRDLLPMYIDHMTSAASDVSIENHIADCPECRAVLEQMKEPVAAEAAPEVSDFKKFLKKSKMALLYGILGAAALIAVVVCFIVNLAMEGQLSWFYIVCVSIAAAYLPAYVYIASHKHRLVKAMAVLSVCAVMLVGTVQAVLYFFMEAKEIWFWEKGLPVTALWITIVWVGIAFQLLFRSNPMFSLAVISLLCAPGNYYTNVLVGEYREAEALYRDLIFNGLADVLAAVVLLLIGIAWQKRKAKGAKGNGEQLF